MGEKKKIFGVVKMIGCAFAGTLGGQKTLMRRLCKEKIGD